MLRVMVAAIIARSDGDDLDSQLLERINAEYEVDRIFHNPRPRSLFLAQHQIQRPTTPDVQAAGPAVVQQVFVVAAGFLNGVGEDWQAVESSVLINAISK